MKYLRQSKHICNSQIPKHRHEIAKEFALPTQRKIVFKKNPTLQKKMQRTADTIMILKLNIEKVYSDTVDRSPAHNRHLAKKRVQ